MCSSLCPCEAAEKTKWQANITEVQAKTFYRSWVSETTKPFKTEGGIVKMQFGPITTNGKTYKSFDKCYTEVLAKKT